MAEILGYSNTRDALAKHVDEEDKIDGVAICDPIGRTKTAGKQSNRLTETEMNYDNN